MPYSVTARTATAAARIAADLPILASGDAALTAVVSSQWRESGSWASGSDIGTRWFGGARAHDGELDSLTRTAAPVGANHYLLFQLSAANPFDIAVVVEDNLSSLSLGSMALEIADDNAFATNMIQLASGSWTAGRRRRVSLGLGPVTPGLYSSVAWARLHFAASAWTVTPQLSELLLMRGYYLPQRPDVPYDNRQELDARVDVYEADTGEQHRHNRWAGRLVLNATWESDDATFAADLRAFWAGCQYGARPFLWIPNPSTAPERAYVMRAKETDFQIEQIENPGKWVAALRAEELAPFVEGGIV